MIWAATTITKITNIKKREKCSSKSDNALVNDIHFLKYYSIVQSLTPFKKKHFIVCFFFSAERTSTFISYNYLRDLKQSKILKHLQMQKYESKNIWDELMLWSAENVHCNFVHFPPLPLSPTPHSRCFSSSIVKATTSDTKVKWFPGILLSNGKWL